MKRKILFLLLVIGMVMVAVNAGAQTPDEKNEMRTEWRLNATDNGHYDEVLTFRTESEDTITIVKFTLGLWNDGTLNYSFRTFSKDLNDETKSSFQDFEISYPERSSTMEVNGIRFATKRERRKGEIKTSELDLVRKRTKVLYEIRDQFSDILNNWYSPDWADRNRNSRYFAKLEEFMSGLK
jgi:hypothetical protein